MASETLFTSRIRKRTPLVYGLLLAVWALIIGWQMLEHRWVVQSARTALINRSRDIASTLGLVIRSQRRFGGIISQDRLESALNELAKSGELLSVALLNASWDVVASAGRPIDPEKIRTIQQGERWEQSSVTLVPLIDLGASTAAEGQTNLPTIVLPPRDPTNSVRGARRGLPRTEGRTEEPGSSNIVSGAATNTGAVSTAQNEADHGPIARGEGPPRGGGPDDHGPGDSGPAPRGGPDERRSRGTGGRPQFGRPFWMDEKEYQSLLEKRGLHGLVMALSTETVQTTTTRDLWLRYVIVGFAGISVLGFGLAWQNLVRSSELQVYLLRASQLNTHLREMNVAAAGLAHETRNPLNIVRGLAQMISKESTASEEIRGKSRQITDEVDRVTAQLNEFINYSRPREVRRAPVVVSAVVGDVVRALQSDIEEKAIQLRIEGESFTVDADEQMLRQVLFNLLINSVQAVDPRGEIHVVSRKSGLGEAQIEVRDNGPGVSTEHRAEIFKPYFTTNPKGTGLGLAVVQQIVLAHGWDIECLENTPKGAIFRISRLKLSSKNGGKA
jgi:signal transduction histidine kinase